MGLNANLLRMRMLPQTQIKIQNPKENEESDKKVDSETDNKSQETTSNDWVGEQAVNSYTYFSIYDGITDRLGDFYSETLAKMKNDFGFSAKGTFNSIYNKIMNDIVGKAVERAKAGEKLDYTQLAQEVKDQVTAELESIDYSPRNYFSR